MEVRHMTDMEKMDRKAYLTKIASDVKKTLDELEKSYPPGVEQAL